MAKDPREVVKYIGAHLAALRSEAREAQLDTLAHLIDMAHAEAEHIIIRSKEQPRGTDS